jgi:hypothetical protein
MPIAKCPLCLQEKPIIMSHLVPAAIYDYTRGPSGHHISMTNELVIETDRELQAYLLCRECDSDLNKYGETWLLPLLATIEGKFPFYDLLTKIPPDAVDNGVAGYAAARNPEIDVDKITHFAIGVFWKAAVHSWSGYRSDPIVDLGPYTERLRTFLRGGTGFPERVALTIGVLTPSKAQRMISMTAPYRGSNRSWHNFLFYVPGIEFAISVGKAVRAERRAECFASNALHPVWVLDFSEDVRNVQRMMFGKARIAKNVNKYIRRDSR